MLQALQTHRSRAVSFPGLTVASQDRQRQRLGEGMLGVGSKERDGGDWGVKGLTDAVWLKGPVFW